VGLVAPGMGLLVPGKGLAPGGMGLAPGGTAARTRCGRGRGPYAALAEPPARTRYGFASTRTLLRTHGPENTKAGRSSPTEDRPAVHGCSGTGRRRGR